LNAGARNPCRGAGEVTDRQREVVQLVAEGHHVKEIAAILNVSGKTVAFHESNVMRRPGIRSTAELTKYALDHGIPRRKSMGGQCASQYAWRIHKSKSFANLAVRKL